MFFLITIFLTALVSALFGLLPGKLQRRSVIKQDIVWAVGLWLATWLFAVFAYHRPGLTIGFNAFRLVAVTALNGWTGFVTAGLRSFGRKGLKAVVPLLLITALGLEVFVGNIAYFNTHSYEPFQLVDYLDENINVGRGLGTISLDEGRTYLRLKNEFISSVSHELRTPLTSIRGWVETISNIDDPTNENYRRGLSIIGTETDRLYTMVEELLDFSRLQNGIKMNCEVLDFVAEATDAALFVEARIRQEGMQLVYSEPPEPYPVWADPARLRQVFVNLFDNAIKYSEPSGTIFLELSRTPVTVTASIRDQGRGIAADDLEKVKQKFFKAKNSVRGSGIGLAVVDEIVGTLGGKFDIASTLGQGTTVTVTLPVYHPGQEHLHDKI